MGDIMTGCECFFGGWCNRHKTYKTNASFKRCKNSEEAFQEYENGGGFRLRKMPDMTRSKKTDSQIFVFGYKDEKLDFLQSLRLPFKIFKIGDDESLVTHIIGEEDGNVPIIESREKEDWEKHIIHYVNDIKPPSLAQKAKNLARATVKHVADGLKKVNQSVYDSRMEICNRCEFLEDGDCLLCGCPVATKASWASESCPAQPSKWPARNEGGGCAPCKKKRGG